MRSAILYPGDNIQSSVDPSRDPETPTASREPSLAKPRSPA